jgi:hypothetical protein
MAKKFGCRSTRNYFVRRISNLEDFSGEKAGRSPIGRGIPPVFRGFDYFCE